jgi:hypothetical protein
MRGDDAGAGKGLFEWKQIEGLPDLPLQMFSQSLSVRDMRICDDLLERVGELLQTHTMTPDTRGS